MGEALSAPDLAQLLRRILSRPPQGPGEWDDERAAFEQALCKAARSGLMAGVERRIGELRAAGFVLEMTPPPQPHWREWTLGLGDKRYVASIAVLVHREMQSAHLVYQPAPPKVRRTRAHRLQEAFYARYNALWDKLRARPAARIAAGDRRLLRVGDLEADVNNGGFGQYLGNKGPREARRALAALQAIGAERTARMLEEALRASGDEAALAALDASFYDDPEDLAALAARHARLA